MSKPKKRFSERLDEVLRLSSDVRPGEGYTTLLMLSAVFVLLCAYYIIKTVREPLILATGGAELKSYASAVQAFLLLFFVPIYSSITKRVDGLKLLLGGPLFFLATFEGFYLAAQFDVPNLGFYFYVWIGIFSVSVLSQFWSYANDVHTKLEGERLFALIAVGATLGAWVGSSIAREYFKNKVDPYLTMQIAVGLLLVYTALLAWIYRRHLAHPHKQESLVEEENPVQVLEKSNRGGFALVFKNSYILKIALILLLLNFVNSTGEYILSGTVVDAAKAHIAALPGLEVMTKDEINSEMGSFIGSFYGDFFGWVNIFAFLMQFFLVSRLVKWIGSKKMAMILPLVALGAYSVIAAGAGLALIRVLKMAENSTDYSIMNTVKALLWLPTSKEEKYRAKQATDTFFVRFGDMLSAGVIFLGTTYFSWGISGFALFNLLLIALWILVTFLLVRQTIAAKKLNSDSASNPPNDPLNE